MKALDSANNKNTTPTSKPFQSKSVATNSESSKILIQTSWLTAEATCNPIWMRSITPLSMFFGGLGNLHPDVNCHDDDSDDDINI